MTRRGRRLRQAVCACIGTGLLVLAGAASAAAQPEPFKGHLMNGHQDALDCKDVKNGQSETVARFCQGGPRAKRFFGLDDKRVVSWDGQPIDADVTLPPVGDGPWPLMVLMHGYAGNKLEWETDDPDSEGVDNVGFARRGYAVITDSARGFGASCGFGLLGAGYILSGYTFRDALLGQAACPAQSWVHLSDARFESHDTQYLAGLLVDEGIAKPAIGVGGESYGGGRSLILARLKDRVMPASCRVDSCKLEPWRSPAGTPMSVAAAAAIVPWSDLSNALLPNGRSIDGQAHDPTYEPIGVDKQDYQDALYLGGKLAGYYAPPGCKGAEPCPDLDTWYRLVEAGEPYDADAEEVAVEVSTFHSAMGVEAPAGGPAPTYIANGWTDDLFPPIEGSRFYNDTVRNWPDVPIAFRVADVGHYRAQNKDADEQVIEDGARDWIEYFVGGQGQRPESGVRAWTQTCPLDAPSGGPYPATGSARSLADLSDAEVTYTSDEPQAVDSRGGRQSLARATDANPFWSELGIGLPPDPCRQTSTGQLSGVATYELPASDGYTMLGLPAVEADITTTGAAAIDGELAARLWDVDPASDRQTMVSRGVYRLVGNQSGPITVQLNGNGWRFEQGHIPKLELLGRDDFSDLFGYGSYRASNNEQFRVRVNSLRLTLPVVSGG